MARKVLLIGWDGADWKVITPLMDAGKMPNLERLVNGGVMGDLRTLHPVLSPMLWTSIATGKRPFKHGILGFTEPDPDSGAIRPVTSLSRKSRAIWNMLHLEGMRSNVVGWWPSHPAEPIRGVMVSNHYHQVPPGGEGHRPLSPAAVHPERLLEPLAELRLHPSELEAEHLGPFVPRILELDPENEPRLQALAKIFCECTTVHAAATALVQLEPWDFMAVYYDAIDHFSHAFMQFHPPRMKGVSERDFDYYQGVVEAAYRYHDMMLGVLLDLAGDDVTVMLVSDHGFHPDHLRPTSIPREPAGPAAQHRDQGIFVLNGPGIRQDERIYGATLLDVTPTILTLYDLPVGEDMDGRALVDVFESPRKPRTIPSWEDREGEDGGLPRHFVLDPVDAHEGVQQLVALGYVEKPDEKAEKAAAQALRELRFNEAQSLADAGRHRDAAGILIELCESYPGDYRFPGRLVTCYQALGRTEQAREVLDGLLERRARSMGEARDRLRAWREEHPDAKLEDLEVGERRELMRLRARAQDQPFLLEYVQGVQLLAEGDPEGAGEHFRNAERVDPESVAAKVKAGEALLEQEEPDRAEEKFREALERDPSNVLACLGICGCMLHRGRDEEAAEAALEAVGLEYYNPAAHYHLGAALHRMGRIARAVEALSVCIRQNPNYVPAHERLARIYEKGIKEPKLAEEHRQHAREAEARLRGLKEMQISPGLKRVGRETMTSEEEILPAGVDLLPEDDVPVAECHVVVSGLPRSGTSMMMQMLSAGGVPPLTDDSRPADPHNERGYFEDERVKSLRRDDSWLPDAKGRAVKVIAQLLKQLPRGENHYRVIFMERDLDEVLGSQRDLAAHRGKPREPEAEKRLARTFRTQLTGVRKLLALTRIPVIYLQHGSCLDDPAATAAKVNAFLGGSLDEAAMATVVDPRLSRHRKE